MDYIISDTNYTVYIAIGNVTIPRQTYEKTLYKFR